MKFLTIKRGIAVFLAAATLATSVPENSFMTEGYETQTLEDEKEEEILLAEETEEEPGEEFLIGSALDAAKKENASPVDAVKEETVASPIDAEDIEKIVSSPIDAIEEELEDADEETNELAAAGTYDDSLPMLQLCYNSSKIKIEVRINAQYLAVESTSIPTDSRYNSQDNYIVEANDTITLECSSSENNYTITEAIVGDKVVKAKNNIITFKMPKTSTLVKVNCVDNVQFFCKQKTTGELVSTTNITCSKDDTYTFSARVGASQVAISCLAKAGKTNVSGIATSNAGTASSIDTKLKDYAGNKLTFSVMFTKDGKNYTKNYTITVRPTITSISVKGIKNNSVKQTTGSTKEYVVNTNANADKTNLKVQNSSSSYSVSFDEKKTKLTVVSPVAHTGTKITIFDDSNKNGVLDATEVYYSFNIESDVTAIEKAKSGCSVSYVSDNSIYIKGGWPKGVDKSVRNLYYLITISPAKNTEVPSNYYTNDETLSDSEKKVANLGHIFIRVGSTAETGLKYIKSGSGDGKSYSYSMTVRIVQMNDSGRTLAQNNGETKTVKTRDSYSSSTFKVKQVSKIGYTNGKTVVATVQYDNNVNCRNGFGCAIYGVNGYVSYDAVKQAIVYSGTNSGSIGKGTIEIWPYGDDCVGNHVKIPITIVESYKELSVENKTNSIYKGINKATTVSPTTVYNQYHWIDAKHPEARYIQGEKRVITKSLLWEIVDSNGNSLDSSSNTFLRNAVESKQITIKNGVVTIAKNFNCSAVESDNQFKIKVKANDYEYNLASAISDVITITGRSSAIDHIGWNYIDKYYSQDPKGKKEEGSTSGMYGYFVAFDRFGNILENVEFSTNVKNAKIKPGDNAQGIPSRFISVKGPLANKTVIITAKSLNGDGSKSSIKFVYGALPKNSSGSQTSEPKEYGEVDDCSVTELRYNYQVGTRDLEIKNGLITIDNPAFNSFYIALTNSKAKLCSIKLKNYAGCAAYVSKAGSVKICPNSNQSTVVVTDLIDKKDITIIVHNSGDKDATISAVGNTTNYKGIVSNYSDDDRAHTIYFGYDNRSTKQTLNFKIDGLANPQNYKVKVVADQAEYYANNTKYDFMTNKDNEYWDIFGDENDTFTLDSEGKFVFSTFNSIRGDRQYLKKITLFAIVQDNNGNAVTKPLPIVIDIKNVGKDNFSFKGTGTVATSKNSIVDINCTKIKNGFNINSIENAVVNGKRTEFTEYISINSDGQLVLSRDVPKGKKLTGWIEVYRYTPDGKLVTGWYKITITAK